MAEVFALLGSVPASPLEDLSDCLHGCNGSPCLSERCTFACHLYEDDEDPEILFARYDAAPKGLTARPDANSHAS